MRPFHCLFYHESGECNAVVRREHIVQAALGGTLSSPDLICGGCNNYFSASIDAEVAAFYEPISKILAPFLPGKSRRQKKNSQLISGGAEQCAIEYVGGCANLAKIKKIRSPSGRLEGIIAPVSTDPETLRRIGTREGAKVQSAQTMLLSEYFPGATENAHWSCNHTLMRGILLDILEMAAYASLKENSPKLVTHCCLGALRLWVRTGRPSRCFPPKNILYSFAPITDLLSSLFTASTFSHKLVVSFDHVSEVMILVAQFFDTMPWVVVLENVPVHHCSVSILYKKALMDGDDQLLWENRAVLDSKDVRWRTFSTATREACEFAQIKLAQELHTQHARAHYQVDLRNDAYIRDRLTYYAKKSAGTPDASIDAIVKLVENRYDGSDRLADIVRIARDMAVSRWTGGENQEMQRLTLYRHCLEQITKKYGYPSALHSSKLRETPQRPRLHPKQSDGQQS